MDSLSKLATKVMKEIRCEWDIGDAVELYSNTHATWFCGKITQIHNDSDGEWLTVVVDNFFSKTIQRYHPDIRPVDDSINNKEEEKTEDEDDDECKPVVFVERAGTKEFNGRYAYCRKSMFQHIENEQISIRHNNEQRWEFMQKAKIFYFVESEGELPPSSGWSNTKLGNLPNPGVQVQNSKMIKRNSLGFSDEAYNAYSPFVLMEHSFCSKRSFGFELKILHLHKPFVAVKCVKKHSFAHSFGVLPNDIIVSVNDEDVTHLKETESVRLCMNENGMKMSKINITFAREKEMSKVLIVQRAGTNIVNGKYYIEGKENESFIFAKQHYSKIKIMKIHIDEDEQMAIWALREIHYCENGEYTDYYIVLSQSDSKMPPEFGWESVENNGKWPAPGIQFYDIKNRKQAK